MPMQLTVSQLASSTVAAPVGRIDQSSADAFLNSMQTLLASHGSASAPLVLDFSGVDYIASVGLRALMVLARQVKSSGGKIAIAALQPMVREVFSIARFDLVIACFDTPDTAARELAAC
jgi:anti-sigma B factor antagonist/stage II sporulation protein AA (anti-sigma F factor antagonist)